MDLLTYSLADLIPFSRETYLRLFERYNVGVWPAAIVGLALGVMALFAAWRPEERGRRAAISLVALGWLWVGWGFMIPWYGPLLWAGPYFAIGFTLQGVLLAGTLWRGLLVRPAEEAARDRLVALSMVAFALVVQPLMGLLEGRSWYGLEVFGTAPDPTAVATLGLLLIVRHPLRWLLSIIPLIWCLIGGATLFVLSSPAWPIMPLAGALYLGTAVRQWLSERRAVPG